MSKSGVAVPYSEAYIDKCFYVWYSYGRPSRSRLYPLLPEDEFHRKPNMRLTDAWRKERNWDFRADELDTKVQEQADDAVIQAKVDMLKRQADLGAELQDKGMDYLRNNAFDSSASAVSAVVKGVDIERTSRGIGEFLLKLTKMSDVDIKDEIAKLSARSGDIIDVEEVDKPEDDTESKEESNDDLENA